MKGGILKSLFSVGKVIGFVPVLAVVDKRGIVVKSG